MTGARIHNRHSLDFDKVSIQPIQARAIQEVTCPRCQAKPGDKCFNIRTLGQNPLDQKRVAKPHQERVGEVKKLTVKPMPMSIVCPTCNRGVGEHCVYSSGKTNPKPHRSRSRIALRKMNQERENYEG